MKIILDTNIIISALIRDSFTRKIILQSGFEFYFPDITLAEIRKYETMILKKSGLTLSDYKIVFNKILEHIILIPTETLRNKLEEAKKIMEGIDPQDSVFIAASLSYDDSVIWSDDKDFLKQNKTKVITTEQIKHLLI